MNKNLRSIDHVKNKKGDIFLERILDELYDELIDRFTKDYNLRNGVENGGKIRFANYFLGIDRSLCDEFVAFIEEIMAGIADNKFPPLSLPSNFTGIYPHTTNLLESEEKQGFSFGSYDMAVTKNGLKNIEFQAIVTYPISASKLNHLLIDKLELEEGSGFADSSITTWGDFIALYQNIIAGKEKEGIVLTDRNLQQQKTNFEFFATQKELGSPIEIVDIARIFEKEGQLFYWPTEKEVNPIKITRLYNRASLTEAILHENYPQDTKRWKFTFDKEYKGVKFVNHPYRFYEISKRLSPYIHHPFNPDCFELSNVASHFRTGKLRYDDYVFKHKRGGAGRGLLLLPTAEILEGLSNEFDQYLVQKKVNYELFKTGDGQEKIVELRFMTAQHKGKINIVPMARIGHVTEDVNGRKSYKIHFADNEKTGYGFCPVIVFDRKVK